MKATFIPLENFKNELIGYNKNEYNTIYDLLKLSFKKNNNRKCFGYRKFNNKTKEFENKYRWFTFNEIKNKIINFSNGIKYLIKNELNLNKEIQIPIGIYLINNIEWCISDLSNSFQNLITLPFPSGTHIYF